MLAYTAMCSLLLVAGEAARQQPAKTHPTCADYGHPLFGCVVCAPGDADGDGTPDFLVADTGWNRDTTCPRAWLLSGYSDRVLFTRALEGGDWNLELGIIGVEDCDGDGVGDWLLSPGWRHSHQPACLTLISGKSGVVLREFDPHTQLPKLARRGGAVLIAPVFNPTVLSGRSPEEARVVLGDLDRDGVPDVALGGEGWVEFRSGKNGNCLRRLFEPSGPVYQGFGRAIARLGDIDGDGLDDLAIASPDAMCDAKVQAFSSGTGKCLYTVGFDLSAIGWGERIAALGDMDGDGCSELAVATWSCENTQPGQACILSGKTGRILALYRRPIDDLIVAGDAARQQPAKTRPTCADSGHPLFGSIVCAPGDADGDGVPDLIVADPSYENEKGTARAWLVSGKTMSVLFDSGIEGCRTDTTLYLRSIEGAGAKTSKRWTFSSAVPAVESERPPGQARLDLGDLDADGTHDYAIRDQTRVVLISGKDGKVLRMIEPSTAEGWSDFGASMVAMGDVDGDKLCDIAIGSPEWGVAEGLTRVYSSATGKCLYAVESDGAEWHSGRRLAALGDIDGDGISELAVATWHARSHDPGRARIVSGKNGRTLVTFVRNGNELVIEKRVPPALPK